MIPFKGLSLGIHSFDWDIDKAFFETIENPDILDCKLRVDLELEKQERMMILNFDIKGHVQVTCDRCLDLFDMPVDVAETYYIKFGDEYLEESESVLVIPDSEYQIGISQLIFDFVSLAIPIRKVHPDDGSGNSMCNMETLRQLKEHSEKKEADPRWEALKNIKLDNNN